MSLLKIGKTKKLFEIYLSTHLKLTLKSMKISRERHLALYANFEKDVESFSAEGRAGSVVMSYIKKRNAVEQSQCWMQFFNIDWQGLAEHFDNSQELRMKFIYKEMVIVTVDMDLQWDVVFSSIVEAAAGFVFIFFFS